MLIIISDLHLTDGTSDASSSPGALHLLAERMADLAAAASYHADGTYRPIERIDLVLLGDVLDLIHSTRWLEDGLRPWLDPRTPEMLNRVTEITHQALRHNEIAASVLRSLAGGSLRIPPATRLGRPAAAASESMPVPVRIHYMVGNRDWFLHVPGEEYNQLRGWVATRLGLANARTAPFPHAPDDDAGLLAALRRHDVVARHGDMFDTLNFGGDRAGSSVGDVIVIELLQRFERQIHQELSAELSAATLLGLQDLHQVRPLLLVPSWLQGLLQRTCPQPAICKAIQQIWNRLSDELIEHPFVRHGDGGRPGDFIDGLRRALKFDHASGCGPMDTMRRAISKFHGTRYESYADHALSEQDFRNRRARHIVYGHTHHAEVVPLDASYADRYVLNQVFFNTGTFRRVYRQTRQAPSQHEFIAADTLTYLAFFAPGERKGRPYETWSGTLGTASPHAASYRVDRGSPSQEELGSAVPSPVAKTGGPHFRIAPAPGVPSNA